MSKKLALVNLPSQIDLKTQCVEAMERQWSEFKEHFVVEKLTDCWQSGRRC